MAERLDVLKTYKLYIDGAFPRSESGRTMPMLGRPVKGGKELPVLAHVARASRKDLRDAVEAARRAQPKWADATAYLRGQILYRMAEMLEGKRGEFVDALESVADPAALKGAKATKARTAKKTRPSKPLDPEDEVSLAIDRLVNYAGWSDKFSQVVGCQNAVAGPFYNFTIPEATGVVAAVAPRGCPLLALVTLIAPVICAGNTVVVLASEGNPLVGAILGEVFATSDLPGGVVNILTAEHDELLPHLASHRDIDAIHAANLSPDRTTLLRTGMAENLKRVMIHSDVDWTSTTACQSPWWIEPFVEFKTIWHPSAV
jgi:acyl-CoA reductase-like NAD-dependent aldehyde dehydrogenase